MDEFEEFFLDLANLDCKSSTCLVSSATLVVSCSIMASCLAIRARSSFLDLAVFAMTHQVEVGGGNHYMLCIKLRQAHYMLSKSKFQGKSQSNKAVNGIYLILYSD